MRAIQAWCDYIHGRLGVDDIEGPWRQSGNHKLVQELLAQADLDEDGLPRGDVTPPPGTHITTATSLVGKFLKQFRGAVLHSADVDGMLEAGTDVAKLQQVVVQMGPSRGAILRKLCDHWHLVAQAKDGCNKMTSKYLAKAVLHAMIVSSPNPGLDGRRASCS